MKSGLKLISDERFEQQTKHQWTAEHDDQHELGELKNAALYCLTLDSSYWPDTWEEIWKEKFYNKNDVDRLIVAGALIAAEIDRRLRLKHKNDNSKTVKTEG